MASMGDNTKDYLTFAKAKTNTKNILMILQDFLENQHSHCQAWWWCCDDVGLLCCTTYTTYPSSWNNKFCFNPRKNSKGELPAINLWPYILTSLDPAALTKLSWFMDKFDLKMNKILFDKGLIIWNI